MSEGIDTPGWHERGQVTIDKVRAWRAEADKLLHETMEGPYSVIVALADYILRPPVAGEMETLVERLEAADKGFGPGLASEAAAANRSISSRLREVEGERDELRKRDIENAVVIGRLASGEELQTIMRMHNATIAERDAAQAETADLREKLHYSTGAQEAAAKGLSEAQAETARLQAERDAVRSALNEALSKVWSFTDHNTRLQAALVEAGKVIGDVIAWLPWTDDQLRIWKTGGTPAPMTPGTAAHYLAARAFLAKHAADAPKPDEPARASIKKSAGNCEHNRVVVEAENEEVEQ